MCVKHHPDSKSVFGSADFGGTSSSLGTARTETKMATTGFAGE